MTNPQPGLFIEETAQHYHVEWDVRPGVSEEALVAALSAARIAATDVRSPNTVWGFHPALWAQLSAGDLPAAVHPFAGVTGTGGAAPATPHSIWLWVHGNAFEKVWQAAYSANEAMRPVADQATELRTYVAFDNRDPIGFIDGTENPPVDEALELALFPAGGPGAGGSAVLIQKWVHRLDAFHALSEAEQEAVIGRTRANSTELDDAVKPATSHVSRNVIEDKAGDELHIYRRNTPFASINETGTFFIGCTNDPPRMDLMLERMFGATDDGLTDHLTQFSDAVSGAYYFVPSMDALTRVFGGLKPEEDGTGVPVQPSEIASNEKARSGSLGIGSLRAAFTPDEDDEL